MVTIVMWKLVDDLANYPQLWFFFSLSDYIERGTQPFSYGFLNCSKAHWMRRLGVWFYWTTKDISKKLKRKYQLFENILVFDLCVYKIFTSRVYKQSNVSH